MKAVVKTKPEVGIEVIDIPMPIGKGKEVLLKVKACGVCGTDFHIYEWSPWAHWISLPRVLGHEISGVIVEVGEGVEGFDVGDRVVCETSAGCGSCYLCQFGKFNLCIKQKRLGQHIDGGMAEYLAVQSMNLFRLPENVPFEEASVIEPLAVAMHAVERSQLRPGDVVTVLGLGPIGLLTMLSAKAAGAARVIVTGLGADRERLRTAEKLGAETVCITEGDPTKEVLELTGGRGADIVFEATGAADAVSQVISFAKLGGEAVIIGLFSEPSTVDAMPIVRKELTIHGSWRRLPQTWYRAINLVASGKIDLKPLISHTLPIRKAPEAFKLIERRKAMKVIIGPDI